MTSTGWAFPLTGSTATRPSANSDPSRMTTSFETRMVLESSLVKDSIRLARLTGSPTLPLLRTEPQLAAHLIRLLCQRVRWTAQLSEDSALLSLPARLAKRLLSLAVMQGDETAKGTRVAISQEELAQFLGVSRQIVNQHLQAWKVKGYTLSGRGHITVANVSALEALTRES
jgi:CRP-like cAMP-binding protein